jgi:hypothetical protein
MLEFDQTTIANMTAALDTVCKKIPPDKDGHEIRKRIADAMVDCARAGRRTLNDFESVGLGILGKVTRPSSWLGLRRPR